MRDQLIMDIAMNLTRVGNWAADDFFGKQKRILLFLKKTDEYVDQLKSRSYPAQLQSTITTFLSVYPDLISEASKPLADPSIWAEAMMTWGNILAHRAKLSD